MSPFVEIPFLDADELQRVYDGVHHMRPLWVQNRTGVAWWTIGAAAYLDALSEEKTYWERAQFINQFLKMEFDWLNEKYKKTLQEYLGRPVDFARQHALPGFHIFKSDPDLSVSCPAQIHYDRQHEKLTWPEPVANHVSATACIKLPKEGGGLNYWDENEVEHYLPYTEGTIQLHFGDVKHQIAGAKNPQPDDERITYQGQAALMAKADTWLIYR